MGDEMTNGAWEELCRRCGECCFEKSVKKGGGYRQSRVSCRFLDIHTRQCRVYHKRQATGEECLKLTPERVSEADWLPVDCAYRVLLAQRPGLQLVE